jgi:hypothetical protein
MVSLIKKIKIGFSSIAANAATEALLTPILKFHESAFTCSSFIRIKQN